ncbi:HAD family acid phosphatase [Parendozoicomonas sp. Alg238-R29]|uniref:HAD family acid phosphatase n=1 Tax=Parendozoicomonas sp. Alg238-R29 TaxID=2993446 RepID=UPI00248D8C94|nr:HAD family acid phosphatase [Parendozoicomonas sp. Alg238-R29]
MSQPAHKCLVFLHLLFSCQLYALEWKDLYEQTTLAMLWQQHSEESRALSWQTFNMAADVVDQQLEQTHASGKKPALVTDIDDTIIQASAYFAGFIGSNEKRTKERDYLWWQSQPPKLTPGAKYFLSNTSSKGVEILYLTARYHDPIVASSTLEMLSKADLPYTDTKHLQISSGLQKSDLIRLWGEQENRQIILTMGDKMADLGFELPIKSKTQKQWLENNPSKPGQHSLLQTNAAYGTWECVTHGYCPHSPDEEHTLRQNKAKQLVGDFQQPPSDFFASDKFYRGTEMGHLLEWTTESAEYPFITRQIYNRASQYWKQSRPEQGAAVVIDIDGTIVQNIPFPAHVFLNNHTENPLELFNHWAGLEQPQALVAGAKEYLHAVKEAGGEIFYVTNRPPQSARGNDMRGPLLASLEATGLPVPDSQHLLMFGDFSDRSDTNKRMRFAAIRTGMVTGKPVNVAQMIGDRIEDIEIYADDLAIDNDGKPEGALQELGRSRFLLPFPLYTPGWLRRLYKQWHGNEWQSQSAEKLSASRKGHIEAWTPSP